MLFNFQEMWERASNYIEKTCDFIYKRVPNSREILTATSINSAIELSLGEIVNYFGENPSAKNIIKDASKIPSTLSLVFAQVEIGGTGYNYDEGNAYAVLVKFGCKAAMLGSYSVAVFYNPAFLGHFEGVARVTNYICEIPSRFIIITGQHRQNANATNTPYLEFMKDNWESSWVMEVVVGSFSKVAVADMIGEYVIKPSGMNSYLRAQANTVHNSYFQSLIGEGSITNPLESMWKHLNAHMCKLEDFMLKMKIATVTIVSEYVFKWTNEVFTAYVQISMARSAQDFTGKIVRSFKNSEESQILIPDHEECSIATETINFNSLAVESHMNDVIFLFGEYKIQPVCLVGDEESFSI